MENNSNIYSELLVKYELTPETFKKGRYLFREGDSIDAVYYIQKGEVFIMRDNFILWVAQSSEIIGVSSYVSSQNNSFEFSARTGSSAVIYKIPVTIFKQELSHNVLLSQVLMRDLCLRIDKIGVKTRNFRDKSSRNRLIELLVAHSRASGNLYLTYKLSEISELVGVSARTIRSMLNELEEKRLVRQFRDTLEILDLKGLEIIGKRL